MASRADRIRGDALSLPTQERARLAGDLIASLDDAQDPGAADAWVADLERRASEGDSGSGTGLPCVPRWASRWRKP